MKPKQLRVHVMHLLDAQFPKMQFTTLFNSMYTFILVVMLPQYFLAKIFSKIVRLSSYHKHVANVPRSRTVNVQHKLLFFTTWKL